MSSLHKLKQEQLIGLAFVLLLHGAGLYGLWRYKIIPTPDKAIALMVNFINPPAPEKPKPPEPPKLRPLDPPPPEHIHLAVETPVVLPDEPVVYVPPPEPVVEAPPPAPPQMELPSQLVTLSSELSVICSERAAPHYPMASKRMNEQGKAVLRVELGEDGKVANAMVKASSGFARLDEAALAAIKTWRCKPPVRNGAAVRASALQAFNFSLSE
ncbi:MAG: energy transducer TonB [Gallionella sp.]|nr:energy transducer TonB [Gallionella sp.]